MFCPQCGTEVPEDARFCMKCGHVLGAVAPAPAAAPAPAPAVVPAPVAETKSSGPNKWGLKLVGLLVLIGLVWIVAKAVSSLNHSTGGSGSGSTVLQILPQPRTQTIIDGALTVAAMGFTYYTFTVPADATSVSVDGHFTATGGTGNDIEVYVLNDDDFVNFKNGHSAPTLYNSGKVTQDSISATIPATGTYYLVFNNNFSLLTPKAVQATATLHYTN